MACYLNEENMKKILVVLATSALFAAPVVLASNTLSTDTPDASMQQKNEPFQQAREKLKKMTPEQRETFMKNARTKWNNLPPEEKQKFKVQMRDKMRSMKKQNAERKIVRVYSLYLLEQEQEQQ